jgi:hypothetical protein
MKKPECAKAKAFPKFEHQNTCKKKNTNNKFSHRTIILISIAVKNKNEMT